MMTYACDIERVQERVHAISARIYRMFWAYQTAVTSVDKGYYRQILTRLYQRRAADLRILKANRWMEDGVC